jgi:hypothetical protein
MRLPRSKALSANSVREVLARTPHRLDVELTGKTGDSVYALPDGGLLLIFSSQDGRGRLYESRDEFVAMYQHAEKLARRGPINPFRELLPQANFVSTVDDLVRQLPSALKLDAAILDKSEASLEAIDRVLRKMRTERVLTSAVFASLFAYVGEVMRLKTGGRWEMRLDSDGYDVDALDCRFVRPQLRCLSHLQRDLRTSPVRLSSWPCRRHSRGAPVTWP